MKIQELAEKTGLTAYTIQFYEKAGLLDSRHIVTSGTSKQKEILVFRIREDTFLVNRIRKGQTSLLPAAFRKKFVQKS